MPDKFTTKLKFAHGKSVCRAYRASKWIGERTLVACWRLRRLSRVANFFFTFYPRAANEPKESSFRQNAETSTLQTGAPQNSAKPHLARPEFVGRLKLQLFS
jgi:hypothetical protein